MRDDMLQVRAPALCFYVLRDSNGLYLIDGGFIGGRYLLARALRRRGWEQEPIRGIIVTHGHLDHILNVASIANDSGAWIAAPRLDAAHYEGRFPYRGAARVCGLLEAIGRRLFSYSPFETDRWLDDYSEIPVWHGLIAIHLPGHTDGHMGLYCPDLKLLILRGSVRKLRKRCACSASDLQQPSRIGPFQYRPSADPRSRRSYSQSL